LQANGTEQGYNTDARSYKNNGNYQGFNTGVKTQFDEKSDPNYTTVNSIRVNSVPIVNIGGVNYREFFLDINEDASAAGHLISLDQLQIFLSSSNLLDQYSTANGGTLAGGNGATSTRIYSLDTGFGSTFTDNWIKLDYNTNGGGSGKGDMVF